MDLESKDGYGFTVFKPGTPKKVKIRGLIFFFICCGIILAQSFFWIFANSVTPYVMGMPFSMFIVVLFIAFEFFVLLALYRLEYKDGEE